MSRVLHKLYGTALTAYTVIRDRGTAYLPVEELRRRRDQRVRRIVRHAVTTVPYYRDLFVELGIAAQDIRTAEDLAQLPLLSRELVQRQPERFLSSAAACRESVALKSSGATGRPLTVRHDIECVLQNTAFNLREREVVTKVLGQRHGYRALYVSFPESSVVHLADALRRHRFRPRQTGAYGVLLTQPVEEVIEAVNRSCPDVLSAYGSYMEALFRTIAARGIEMHIPRVAIYGSDTMTDAGKRLVQEHFGVRLLSTYSAIEALKIGFTCEVGAGLHLHDDITHVRIADPQGRTVPPGERGEVVISNLLNRATVLLNYRLGDLGRMSNEECSCGRTLPLLARFEGRAQDLLYLPDGRFLCFIDVLRVVEKMATDTHRQILQYQLVQHALQSFELRLATADRATFERAAPDLVAALRPVLGESASIDAVYFEQRLPLGPGGKHRLLVSLVGPQAAEEERDVGAQTA